MCWNRNIINNVIDCLNNCESLSVCAQRFDSIRSRSQTRTGYYKLKSYQSINILALCESAGRSRESSPSLALAQHRRGKTYDKFVFWLIRWTRIEAWDCRNAERNVLGKMFLARFSHNATDPPLTVECFHVIYLNIPTSVKNILI